MGKRHLIVCLTVWGIFGLWHAGVVHADIVNYTVDSTQSSLSISGTWGAEVINASDVESNTSYGGSITVAEDLGTNSMQFLNASISAFNQPNTVSVPFETPFNYTFTDSLTVNTHVVMRDFYFSLSSDAITSPSSFDVSQISAQVISGEFDYATFTLIDPNHPLEGFSETDGTSPLPGTMTLNPEVGSLNSVAGEEVLTIPVSSGITMLLDGEPLNLSFSGQIVAEAPEPLTIWLLFPVVFFAERRSRRVISV